MIWRDLLRTDRILPVLLRRIQLYHPLSRDVNEISAVPPALKQAPFRPAPGNIDHLVEMQSFQPRREVLMEGVDGLGAGIEAVFRFPGGISLAGHPQDFMYLENGHDKLLLTLQAGI